MALVSPKSQANIAASGSISLQATASDADGSISSVEFFVDGSSVGSSTSPSSGKYMVSWSSVSVGGQSLDAFDPPLKHMHNLKTVLNSPLQVTRSRPWQLTMAAAAQLAKRWASPWERRYPPLSFIRQTMGHCVRAHRLLSATGAKWRLMVNLELKMWHC